MTDPAYLPLERRVAVATEEIRAAEQVTGTPTMYAFNITGDLAGLRRRHDLVVEAGGRCVMLNVPVMGLPALAWLRELQRGTDPRPPGRPRRLDALTRASACPTGSGSSSPASPAPTTCTSADCGSKFYETDEEVAANIRSLREPLGDTIAPVPTLSSGQNVTTAAPTYAAVALHRPA